MTVPILNGFVETAIAGDDASAHDSMISEFVTLTVNNAWQQVVFTFEWKCSTFTPKKCCCILVSILQRWSNHDIYKSRYAKDFERF